MLPARKPSGPEAPDLDTIYCAMLAGFQAPEGHQLRTACHRREGTSSHPRPQAGLPTHIPTEGLRHKPPEMQGCPETPVKDGDIAWCQVQVSNLRSDLSTDLQRRLPRPDLQVRRPPTTLPRDFPTAGSRTDLLMIDTR